MLSHLSSSLCVQLPDTLRLILFNPRTVRTISWLPRDLLAANQLVLVWRMDNYTYFETKTAASTERALGQTIQVYFYNALIGIMIQLTWAMPVAQGEEEILSAYPRELADNPDIRTGNCSCLCSSCLFPLRNFDRRY